jgi:hypothetical protein
MDTRAPVPRPLCRSSFWVFEARWRDFVVMTNESAMAASQALSFSSEPPMLQPCIHAFHGWRNRLADCLLPAGSMALACPPTT